MKIGIISDIHAHLEPLKRAVSFFKSQDVSHIICAGDLVDGGWEEDAVIDYVREHNIISVRGNHDRQAFSEMTDFLDDVEDTDNSDFGEALNSYRAKYVSSLPTSRHFTWEGRKIYLTHGAPWSDTEHVFPESSIDICRKILNLSEADIVVLGHTHIPMKIQIGEKWILNSGALSGNRDDLKRSCGILQLPQSKFELFDVDTYKVMKLKTIAIDA